MGLLTVSMGLPHKALKPCLSRDNVVAEPKPGFTWRSALALLVTSLVFTPISIYLQLVAGISSIPAVAIVMAILFSEITRLTGNPLTKQEILIIYQMSALAAGATTCYLAQVFKSYVMTSPIAWSFRLNGIPLPQLIPSWWAPPPSSSAYVYRTFLHWDWLIPLLIVNIQSGLFYYLVEISLALMVTHIYVEIEKLPFPLAAVDVSLVTTIAEREPARMKLFVLSSFPGLVWGSILYLIPSLTGITLVPLPWLDLAPWTSKWLPGAILGLSTDIFPYVSGFFIPFHVALYMFASSIAVWVVGNNLTLTMFRSFFPEWVEDYFQGMSTAQAYSRSLLRVWIVPQIAFAYASVLVALIFTGRNIVQAFKPLFSLRSKLNSSFINLSLLRKIIIMYVVGTVGSVILFHILVPHFPLWIAFALSVFVSFLNAIISTRSIGETGYSVSIPYEWYTAVYLSGYRGVDAWIFQPVIGGLPSLEGGAPYWAYMAKVAYLTQTRLMDVFKALVFNIVLYNVFSFVWTEFFWRIAPIPSSAYPYAVASWPAQLVGTAVWITGGISVKPWLFISSFAAMSAILLAGEVASRMLHLPFSSMGILMGTMSIPPFTIPILIGSLLNKYVLPRLIGRERWENDKAVMVAGLSTGQGVATGVGIALLLISKATWLKPW